MYLAPCPPKAPIEEGNFPMGISKIGPNKFFIKARVKVPNPDPRKPRGDRRKQEFFTGTKAQAQDRYLEIKAELRGKRVGEVKTFGDLLALYRDGRGEIPRSQKSVYETLARDLGPVRVDALETTLRQYSGILRRLPSKSTGKPLANGSINRHRAMVATALNIGVELGTFNPSPLTKSVWPKLKEIPRDRFLDTLELQNLLNVVEREAPHLLGIIRFALLVPCRKGELIRMGRHDLDLFNNAIRVSNGTTKNDEGSWKPIPPELIPYFRALPPECPFLFYRMEGGQYFPLGDFKKSWARCLRLAGLQNFRFHDSRHISATNMVDAGTPERAVMDIAGWKTNMLSGYYKSSSKKALGLVRFPAGSIHPGGNPGATSGGPAEKGGENRAEMAVS